MKSFNIATGQFLRRFIGFIGLIILDVFIFQYFDTDFKLFLFLLLNSFLFYFIIDFSSFGSMEYISIDFRSKEKIEQDNHDNRLKLIEGSMNNLIMEATLGNISKNTLKERLEMLEEIKLTFTSNNLLQERHKDYV